jgi:protoheme ferro-lyase
MNANSVEHSVVITVVPQMAIVMSVDALSNFQQLLSDSARIIKSAYIRAFFTESDCVLFQQEVRIIARGKKQKLQGQLDYSFQGNR